MRKVVNSHKVVELWAAQSQPSATNSRRSLYFEGATIYSYGEHFPIATFARNKQGQRCVLLTQIGTQ